jgi:aldehyde dehydrogenase (NAD+)
MTISPSIFQKARRFYIDGIWTDATRRKTFDVINPATEETITPLAMGTPADADNAVKAAHDAFPAYAATSTEERQALLRRITQGLASRRDELAEALTTEMGGPISRTRLYQVSTSIAHIDEAVRVLDHYAFEWMNGKTRILREPIGVCALITPWNAPIMQIVSKVAPALATGCTMVLKPSEEAPLSAILFTEILEQAGVPRGVFNLLHGTGPDVGAVLAKHPLVDMVSFTGSTHAGIAVAKAAADTVKRVHQELGGKSANILLPDVDLEDVVTKGVRGCYGNSGQSCIAPDRMLVPSHLYERAVDIAAQVTRSIKVGDPMADDTQMGPLVNKAQYDKVQGLIAKGISEGARLTAGGLGRPETLNRGYFVRPTVFAGVSPNMTIAREEIFGPVVSLIKYDSEDEAVRIANATEYGLAAYVQSADPEHATAIARRLRAGYVYTNYAAPDYSAPFGGYRQSGNGREYGEWGFEAFVELKTIV